MKPLTDKEILGISGQLGSVFLREVFKEDADPDTVQNFNRFVRDFNRLVADLKAARKSEQNLIAAHDNLYFKCDRAREALREIRRLIAKFSQAGKNRSLGALADAQIEISNGLGGTSEQEKGPA